MTFQGTEVTTEHCKEYFCLLTLHHFSFICRTERDVQGIQFNSGTVFTAILLSFNHPSNYRVINASQLLKLWRKFCSLQCTLLCRANMRPYWMHLRATRGTSLLQAITLHCAQSTREFQQWNVQSHSTQLTWAWPWDSLPPSKLCCLWDTLSFLLHNLNFSSTRHVLIVPVIWIHSYQVLSKVFLPDSRDGAVLSYCKLRWQFLS